MDHQHRHKLPLTKAQLKRFWQGHKIRVNKWEDGDIDIHVPEHVHKLIMHAKKRSRGVELSRDDVLEGSGIFDSIGHAFKKGWDAVSSGAKQTFSQPYVKPIV